MPLRSVTKSAAKLLADLLTVDGSGSGLDADLVRATTPSATGLSLLSASDAAAARAVTFPYLPNQPDHVSGKNYLPTMIGNATLTLVVDRIYGCVIYVPKSATYDGLTTRVVNAVAASTVRLGLYTINASGVVTGAPLAEGTIASTAANTERRLSFTAITLGPGLYMAVAATSTANIGLRSGTDDPQNKARFGHVDLDVPAGFSGFSVDSAGSGAALPTAPGLAIANGGATPYVSLRKA